MNKIFSLAVGINDYPGSGHDLSGCVNDAKAWSEIFQEKPGEHHILLDSEATLANVTSRLQDFVNKARFGDRIYWHYSGHGSRVPDLDGDENDGMDECLVLHDWQDRGLMTDDTIHRIFEKRRFGVRVYIFSDSCNSGTVARFMPGMAINARTRYFPAEILTPGINVRNVRVRRELKSRTGVMLMSGCKDEESSWDAYINGKYQGAFSWAAQLSYNPHLTMREWHKTIQSILSGKFNQTPQLSASQWQKRWQL